mmetsp:Transcript_4229/g.13169  ORF Transcript_4229/g.13169 Transcript_4229/m.13169 type:complete len:396 (-) Transcript_4229:183-1370(-)
MLIVIDRSRRRNGKERRRTRRHHSGATEDDEEKKTRPTGKEESSEEELHGDGFAVELGLRDGLIAEGPEGLRGEAEAEVEGRGAGVGFGLGELEERADGFVRMEAALARHWTRVLVQQLKLHQNRLVVRRDRRRRRERLPRRRLHGRRRRGRHHRRRHHRRRHHGRRHWRQISRLIFHRVPVRDVRQGLNERIGRHLAFLVPEAPARARVDDGDVRVFRVDASEVITLRRRHDGAIAVVAVHEDNSFAIQVGPHPQHELRLHNSGDGFVGPHVPVHFRVRERRLVRQHHQKPLAFLFPEPPRRLKISRVHQLRRRRKQLREAVGLLLPRFFALVAKVGERSRHCGRLRRLVPPVQQSLLFRPVRRAHVVLVHRLLHVFGRHRRSRHSAAAVQRRS